MLKSLGIGWACSTLGIISVVMLPLPFILERVGQYMIHAFSSHQLMYLLVWEKTTLVEQVRELEIHTDATRDLTSSFSTFSSTPS
jgi:hypothetical protein